MFALGEENQAGRVSVTARPRKKNWLRTLALLAAAVVLVVGTLAVRGWTEKRMVKDTEAKGAAVANYGVPAGVMENAKLFEAPAQDMSAASAQTVNLKKVIRTFSFTLSTRQFDEDLAAIRAALKSHQGYVEESTLSSDYGARRTAYMRVRVPRDTVDAFTAELKGIGRALDVRETAEDVSEQYADVQLRLDTQKAKLQRLQEMLKQAVSVEELLKIESSIADAQYQVDSLTGSLKGMDSKVDYSTVTISLKEEKQQDTAQIKEETLLERMKSAFGAMINGIKAFMEDMLVFLVAALPVILIVIILMLIIKVIYKRRKKS